MCYFRTAEHRKVKGNNNNNNNCELIKHVCTKLSTSYELHNWIECFVFKKVFFKMVYFF